MKIEHLSYLMEIHRQGSISAAAKALYLSPTTLSNILKDAEEELGFPLFERSRSGVSLTPDGEEALALMEEIDDCFEQIKRLRETAASRYQPALITTSPTVHSALALPLNQAFEAQGPDYSLEFQIVTGADIGTILIKNESSIGITYLSNKSLDRYKAIASKYHIKVESIFTDHLYLLVRRDHPLAQKTIIGAEELSNMELAMLEHYHTASSSFYPLVLETQNRCTTFSSIALMKQSILCRNTAAILSGYAIQYHQSADATQLKPLLLTGLSSQINLCLIHRPTEDLQPQERLALSCIRTYFKNLPLPPFSPEMDEGREPG